MSLQKDYEEMLSGSMAIMRLERASSEWYNARKDFLSLPSGDSRSVPFLNRLSEAENALYLVVQSQS